MRLHIKHRTALVSALVGIAVLAAGCSTSSNSGSTPTKASSAPSQASVTPASMNFGSACSKVPAAGAGSFAGMAQSPVATAASNNPVLSTLVTAVKKAGLVDTLNTAKDITVFAPANGAFAAMAPATLAKALADPKGLLTTVLTYHVVSGRLTPAQLPGMHKTLQGGTLNITGSGQQFSINGTANVICGNVQTANATVYIIDHVLMPKSA